MNFNRLRALFCVVIAAMSLALPGAAQAKVEVTFYSHEFGENFPHAFIVMKGTLDANGKAVDTSYGFTAKNVSPALLFGSVEGIVKAPPPGYITKSNSHFTVTVDDAGYAKIMAKVQEWRDLPQKSYNLGKRNCVHFVMDLAATVGLKVNRKTKYRKKPRSFLNEVMALNPQLK